MKAFKYFTMPIVLMLCLIAQVDASSSSIMNIGAVSSVTSGIGSFFKTIYYLIMFALILAAAYYVTKFLAQKGMVQGKSKTMKLVESMPLGADRSLHLVKVGSQYFLIGSASKNMFMMSEIDRDKLFEEQLEGAVSIESFEYDNYDDSIEVKDFSTYLNSMKNNLNKLKSMVRGNNSDEM